VTGSRQIYNVAQECYVETLQEKEPFSAELLRDHWTSFSKGTG
jgi:hypothetical protein